MGLSRRSGHQRGLYAVVCSVGDVMMHPDDYADQRANPYALERKPLLSVIRSIIKWITS